MEWQPIETAPKDGTTIIVCDGDRAWLSNYYSDEHYSHGELKRKSEGWAGSDRWLLVGRGDVAPTHWIKLPPFPKDA